MQRQQLSEHFGRVGVDGSRLGGFPNLASEVRRDSESVPQAVSTNAVVRRLSCSTGDPVVLLPLLVLA